MAFKLGTLSQKEARKILENANLPGVLDRNIKYTLYSKAERMKTIRESRNQNDRTAAAAIEIQRQWRGYNARKILDEILNLKTSAIISVEYSSRQLKTSGQRMELTPDIRAKYNQYLNRNQDKPICMNFSEFCALIIQRWWRKLLENFKGRPGYPSAPPPTTNGEVSPTLSSPSHEDSPADMTPDIELQVRGDSQASASKELERHEGAKVIQRTWRKHIDLQVYRYYRDLINFKTRGDPSLMLKCINPREADLLDPAAGVHIKFRLAGAKFPPNIYYKIFTHRNIADIGAFAPRDYTHADNKRLPVNLIHNKGTKIPKGAIHCYKRWENNGWRLVSDRVVQRMDQDPVVFESTQKTITTFHHSKITRRQDVEKKRKRKKIEWMKKMYKQGMLQAKEAQDPEMQNIIETVAQGMVHAADARGNEAVEDWEVDELLEWTNGLNFDEYLVDWKEFATSAGSEYLSQLKYLPDDPFSLNISTEQACQ